MGTNPFSSSKTSLGIRSGQWKHEWRVHLVFILEQILFSFLFFLKDTAERHDTTDWKLINESVILWIPFYSLTFKDLFRNYQQQICEKRFLISPKWGWVRSVSIFSADSRSLSEDDKGGKKNITHSSKSPKESHCYIVFVSKIWEHNRNSVAKCGAAH